MQNDLDLQRDVMTELKWLPSVDAAQIGVSTQGGVVTLTGQVAHYAEKVAAENATKSVYGVKGLANDIVVQPPESGCRSDTDIAFAALSALKWDYAVPEDAVKAVVRDGWITLEGTLDWQYQKESAQRCVQDMVGVVGVSNVIEIKNVAKSADVKHKIEESFRRHADLDARRINVDTFEGKVTLTGTVSSWSEKDQARSAAWHARGVNAIDDQLLVVP